MCGIVGFTGPQQAAPVLLEGLKRLEYRGYDSAGIAVESGGKIRTEKCSGYLSDIAKYEADIREAEEGIKNGNAPP